MTVQEAAKQLSEIQSEISKVIIGQNDLVRDVLIASLAGGHVLLEGAPGLAKTKTIKTLARILGTSFSRIQFTPDLLPSDVLGSEVYRQETGVFEIRKGPIFANLVLADEINRAPSKVQSALLQAMEEHQVTIGDQTFELDQPFTVLATQNPIEQEGTYPLSEAQVDRFLMKIQVPYPDKQDEVEIMKTVTSDSRDTIHCVSMDDFQATIQTIESIHIDEKIYEYIAEIIDHTRDLEATNRYILHGASPRASIAFVRCARVLAVMNGRDFVLPEDIKSLAKQILRHRIIRAYEAIGDEVSTDQIVERILQAVKVP